MCESVHTQQNGGGRYWLSSAPVVHLEDAAAQSSSALRRGEAIYRIYKVSRHNSARPLHTSITFVRVSVVRLFNHDRSRLTRILNRTTPRRSQYVSSSVREADCSVSSGSAHRVR